MTQKRGLFGTLNPGPNPNLPMAFGYRGGYHRAPRAAAAAPAQHNSQGNRAGSTAANNSQHEVGDRRDRLTGWTGRGVCVRVSTSPSAAEICEVPASDTRARAQRRGDV